MRCSHSPLHSLLTFSNFNHDYISIWRRLNTCNSAPWEIKNNKSKGLLTVSTKENVINVYRKVLYMSFPGTKVCYHLLKFLNVLSYCYHSVLWTHVCQCFSVGETDQYWKLVIITPETHKQLNRWSYCFNGLVYLSLYWYNHRNNLIETQG